MIGRNVAPFDANPTPTQREEFKVGSFQDKVSFIWSVADEILRDDFKRSKYPDVILPFTVLRRIDVDGIGSLAPLIAPVREDGSLSTLGINASPTRVYRRSWYKGKEDLGDVVALEDHNPEMLPTWEWPNIRGVGSHRQAAWAWRYALEDLRSELSKLLKKRRLPLSGGLLIKEAAWEAARKLDRSFGGHRRPEREPIPLESLDECLEIIGEYQDGETDEIRIGDMGGRARVYDLSYMKSEMGRLRAAGVTEMTPPWPTADRWDDPELRHTEKGSVYVWEPYSPEALLAKARIVLEGALEGYRRFVEEYFRQLAPHMQIAATLPARLTGTLILSHIDTTRDRSPYVAWYLDPLPAGSKNEIRVEIGKERATREHMLGVLDRVHMMRPEAAGWISAPEYATGEFFWPTPATELAYELLWTDLQGISWVDGMFNRRFS